MDLGPLLCLVGFIAYVLFIDWGIDKFLDITQFPRPRDGGEALGLIFLKGCVAFIGIVLLLGVLFVVGWIWRMITQ